MRRRLMAWRLAKSLIVLRDQVNTLWPTRSKESDGTIGDPAHASRASDHNPNKAGVVCAMDITHDPKGGCDSYVLAENLRLSRDSRIKFVISNGKIFSSTTSPWAWRPYNGSNPHKHHVHVSVVADRADDVSQWDLSAKAMPAPTEDDSKPIPMLRLGSKGDAVKEVQRLLLLTGLFDKSTHDAVVAFQRSENILHDGIVGPLTLERLRAKGQG